MAQSLGFLLAHRKDMGHIGNVLNHLEFLGFTLHLQVKLKLGHVVEMVGNDVLVSACDNQHFINAGIHNLLNNILNRRLIHNGQHFLWHGFGDRQKTGAQARSRNDRFFYFHNSSSDA